MDQDLKTKFAAMSDDEMMSIGQQYASLTDEAQTLVRDEFKRRNLETPDAQEEKQRNALIGVKTIRQYRDHPEALMARSVLESAGIPCFLRDENTIRIDWLWSNLMGGIRLQVAEADVEAAEAVLSQPIPKGFAVDGQADYEQPKCPNCGSLDSDLNSYISRLALQGFQAGMVDVLLFGFPIPRPIYDDFWHCNHCGTNWIDKATDPDNQ